MTRKSSLTSLKQISEINLTPLMDLTFILLITFIITFPLIEQGVSVNLPKMQADDLSPTSARTITVDKDGAIYLDDFPTTFEALAGKMAILGQTAPETTLMIRGDTEIRYGRVVAVLRLLKKSGLTKMALVTQAEGKDAE